MDYYDDDEWDRGRRRPSPHRYRSDVRRSAHHLGPDDRYYDAYRPRTRSQGNGPPPVVNVFNDVIQDAQLRSEASRSPPYPIAVYPPSPRRGRDRLGEDLIGEIEGLTLENDRLRSRSRGRSDVGALGGRGDFSPWGLVQQQQEMLRWEEERKRLEREYEIKRLQADAKRKADEAAAKTERERIIREHDQKVREEAEEKKAEEQRIKEKIEREKIEAKEKKEREYNEFLREQKEKKEKEEAEKKKKEEQFEEEMRKRLARFGAFTPAQIDVMVREEKVKQGFTNETVRRTTEIDVWRPKGPVYPKIHRDYISVDTLVYYDIPYEYDRTDRNYIIILREMDKYETEVLFEHTRRLRSGKLLLEPAKDKPKYAWYRKRDRSTSRVRKLGILEFK